MKYTSFPNAGFVDKANKYLESGVLYVLGLFFAVLLGMAGQAFVSAQAVGAEMGYIRLGSDYKFKSVPEGKGYRWCKRLCNKDDKCRSWTYLRPNRQCRLKSEIAPKYKNDCCVSGEKKGEQASSTQRLCRQYANRAIADYETSLVQSCGFSNAKWTDDFAVHFDWCMDASVEETKQRQRQRKRGLRQCKQDTDNESGNMSCRQYARKALEQQQTNLDNRCGFNHKIRWRNNFNYYKNWCRENTVTERNKQDGLRQDAIVRCLKRGGGTFLKKCDAYAKASLQQVKRASRSGCGFRDRGRWNRTYKAHYKYCKANNSARVMQKERQARKDKIKRCEANLGQPDYGQGEDDQEEPGGVEFGTLRIGSDYSYKVAPRGADYLWCDNSCKRDPRCKAWSFIKKTRQCRLKFGRGTELKNNCCVSGVKPSGDSRNEKSIRCSGYAVAVIDLYGQGLRNGCYFEDKAWDKNFKNHYRFCMGKPRRSIESDLKEKKSLLRQCRLGEWQLDRSCSNYARQGVSQNKMNLTKKCGFTRKSRWFSSFSRHYDWCSNHSRFERKDATVKRQRFLAACINRGGGRYSKVCDAFSQKALSDVEKAKGMNCGLSGKDWSSQFSDHYQWCLNADNWQRASEEKTRARSLKRCKASGGEQSQSKARCDHFARLSAEQSRSSNQYNCRLKSSLWKLGDVGSLKRWCLKANDKQRTKQFRRREEDLKSCFDRFGSGAIGGGQADEACDDYARTAMSQYRKGVRQECRLRGEEWSDEYDDHYAWCLKVTPARRKRLIFSRSAVLKTCKFTSFFNFGKR